MGKIGLFPKPSEIELDQLQIVKLQAIANVLKNALKEYGHLTTLLSQKKYKLHPIYFHVLVIQDSPPLENLSE